MRTEAQLRRRLKYLDRVMAEQVALCMEHGWGSWPGMFWDKRVIERNTIRWALGMKPKPFCEADMMAGW